MKLLLLMSLLIYSSIQTAQTVIFSRSETEGSNIALACGNGSKVVWSKGTDGGTSTILTAEGGEITQRYRPDPENRYSVLTDSSLMIKILNLSDSGIYYCNAAPAVNLTVNPAPPSAPPNVSCSSPVSSRETDSVEANSENTPQTTTPFASSAATPTSASTVISSEAPTTNSTTQPSSGSDADLSSSTAPPDVSCCSSVSSSTTHRARIRKIKSPTTPLKSPEDSRKKTQSTQTEENGKGGDNHKKNKHDSKGTSKQVGLIITIAVLVGVLLIILALFLQRCYFKRKAARANKTDHVYETINDAALTTQPASSPPKEYEAIYVLAGDPDVIKLGLKNQSAASPLKPPAQSSENNPSEPLYSTIQTVDV
ncbi:hypothetical protein MHYP_G00170320 [Metynnis hypsauchen]